MNPSKEYRSGDVWRGFGYLLAGHLILLLFCTFTELFPPLVVIGLTQLFYALPLTYLHWNRPRVLSGLWIACGLTFLLNSACFGFFFLEFVGG